MRLTQNCDEKQTAAIEALYVEAFPKDERKPFQLILEKCREGAAELLAIEDEMGSFMGMAVTVLYQDLVLLDYFAIAAGQRGNGIGTEIFKLLRKKYEGKRFFLEIERTDVEAENIVQRKKRKEFYLRNGMKETGLLVWLFGVEMEVLTDSCRISYEEYYGLYKGVFGTERMGKNIRLIASE